MEGRGGGGGRGPSPPCGLRLAAVEVGAGPARAAQDSGSKSDVVHVLGLLASRGILSFMTATGINQALELLLASIGLYIQLRFSTIDCSFIDSQRPLEMEEEKGKVMD